MPTIRGRGPQVVLEGYARTVARGAAGRTMRDNIAAMDTLVGAGLVADGNTVDGSSRTGGTPYDTVVAQFPDETLSAWDIPAPLLKGGSTYVANVIDFGADPTGAVDSTLAFQQALATGKNVWVPSGRYLIRGQLVVYCVDHSQTLYGDGVGATTLVVDDQFDPTVTTGVIVLTNTQNEHRPELRDLSIYFVQPLDIATTSTAATGTGGNPLTVANPAGIVVGMSVVNRTNPNSILSSYYQTATAPTTVTGIAGNVISISRGITAPGISVGDVLQFASVRSQFKTLAAGGTATQGGTGVQYPWAVYASPQGTVLIQRIMVTYAWNGVYIRGSSFQFEKVDMSAFNIGLDIDACHNFATAEDYRFWNWGNRPDLGVRDALMNAAYDGVTIAGNIGATDGGSFVNFQSWRGHLNITPTFTWGSFTNLMLDGDNTNFSILANSGAWLQITNFYSTKGANSLVKAFVMNPANPKFRVTVNGFQGISAAFDDFMLVQAGNLTISDAYFWNGVQAVNGTMIQMAGGNLYLNDALMDASGARNNSNYIGMGGAGTLTMHDIEFIQAAGTNSNAINATNTNTVTLDNVLLNGWGLLLGTGPIINNAYQGLPWLVNSASYANDAAAAAAGVQPGDLYRSGSAVMVRVA